MPRLVPITAEQAHDLVAALIADGGPHAIVAARKIEQGVDYEHVVALEDEQRDAILGVLEDPRVDLEELRSAIRRRDRR